MKDVLDERALVNRLAMAADGLTVTITVSRKPEA
jgi:hypothetical protein